MARVFTITEGLENMGAVKTGGQGSVYKGRRTGDIFSAIKLLPTPIHSESEEDKAYRDFKNEVEKLKKVNENPTPNVVKILSYGITETGNLPFIEMEFIEGPDLEELLKPPHDNIFTIKEIIKVAEQLSNALAYCHRVDVKHGDIKSNNVKYNIHTGNYVLLDFGLAIMSHEQRRTSLRGAGAIEFMAPEQNEGLMLMETDIYSFGIIIYELLAGRVPFPLNEKGETARNAVMIAHMETTPPDALLLRRQYLPQDWADNKKAREMAVPQWVLSLINKCLQKKPADRFQNGMELHEFVVQHSTIAPQKLNENVNDFNSLRATNETLKKEKEEISNLLMQYQQTAQNKDNEIAGLKTTLADKEAQLQIALKRAAATQQTQAPVKKGVAKSTFFALLLITFGLGFLAIYGLFSKNDQPQRSTQKEKVEPVPEVVPPKRKSIIGQYKISAEKAYFHNEPNQNTRRNAYMVPSPDIINALDEENDFIYTEFTNSKGQTSKGWLRKQDVVSLDDYTTVDPEPEIKEQLTKIEINSQLQQAKAYLQKERTEDALVIYKYLSDQGVPEAMYQYGNLALQNRNYAIDCNAAFDLVKKASDADFAEAKRTLGFLYLFANNKEVLKASNYNNCRYEKNVVRGTRLLMEAVFAGDSTAQKILDKHKEDSSANRP